MANWAKLQEDLVGLPVAKRAKHGIHFKKGANEFVANFSGKPCHYEDGGIWKPIDTKLVLLPDGFYGCPHSKVKVHPDGRMAVAGTDYAQRVELPSAKTGLADGDKLVREFSFGKQELRITEVGFKSEITLNRIPTLTEARKLIASESGTLSKKYLKSLTTATDANGDSHTFSTLSAFRTWLASATFPVVIDPDFSVTSTSGDVDLNSSDTDRNYGQVGSLMEYGGSHLIRFDCSSIDSSNTVTAASFGCTKTGAAVGSTVYTWKYYSVSEANGDWVEGNSSNPADSNSPCWLGKTGDGSGGVTDAWAGSAGCQTSGTDYEATELLSCSVNRGDAQYTSYSFDFNASGIARIQNWLGATNTNYGLLCPTNANSIKMASSESVTESYRPVLTVTYSAAGGFHPINMNAQMQSLSGNMRG